MENQQQNNVRDPLSEGLLPPNTEVRGFKIVRVLRTGWSNTVYVAISPEGEEVALKEYFPRRLARRLPSKRLGVSSEMHRKQFESGVTGFVAETIALSRIESDLLSKCVCAFRANGTAYLAIKWVSGPTLEEWTRDYLRRSERPPEADLRRIFTVILDAVNAMHKAGFLHLDIKPSNVIMEGGARPVLIDLGGARRYPYGEGKHVSVSNYTAGFAAPEQHADQQSLYSPSTDIYGLGATLVYCMTGKIPQIAPDRIGEDKVELALGGCEAVYGQGLIGVVRKSMSLKMGDRYTNCCEMRQVLDLDR